MRFRFGKVGSWEGKGKVRWMGKEGGIGKGGGEERDREMVDKEEGGRG